MNYFDHCKFKYDFRDYQKRILDEIHSYRDDGKIHIVAAPGAGKTILALQLMIEIGSPTLICVPTIALREQWIERFNCDFNNNQDIVSDDISHPKVVTICTYQSIFSAYRSTLEVDEEYETDEEIDESDLINSEIDFVKLLKAVNTTTIILDEAHHLKKSWWEALTKMVESLGDVEIISLTATPPYDVKSKEWNNYLGLCGEIDAEITVPELVKQANLCPHQDYIYFNYPNENDLKEFDKYNTKTKGIFDRLCQDELFTTAISLNPGMIDINNQIDYFIKEFDYFVSILSFLNYKKVPIANEELLTYTEDIPEFSLTQMEILLTNCLFGDKRSYEDFKKLFKEVRRELNEIGAIEDSKVSLIYSKEIRKLISQNNGKLDSINRIIESEHRLLASELKLVVITDYIREDIYEVENDTAIGVMGAIPIFKSIRESAVNNINVAVLTGKIVIIPTSLKEQLLSICKSHNIDSQSIEITELAFDFDYSRVTLKQGAKRKTVAVITELFATTNINVLVGTASLIGEGWDAPFINSLIMANFASSYVMSNQVRGRAIRVDKNNKKKTSSIWHLVCVEKSKDDVYRLGPDYEVMERRFKAFEGIHLTTSQIDQGLERMEINKEDINLQALNDLNHSMLSSANDREKICVMWSEAVETYIPVKKEKLTNECLPRLKVHQTKIAINQIMYISLITLAGCLVNLTSNAYKPFLNVIILALIIYCTYQLVINRNDQVIIGKIGEALLNTFCDITKIKKSTSLVINKFDGKISFYIKDGTLKEGILFNNSLKEMMSPLDVPRYLVVINGVLYPVPTQIAKSKNWTTILQTNLKKSFRSVKIIYTKNEEGKKMLLALKVRHLQKFNEK